MRKNIIIEHNSHIFQDTDKALDKTKDLRSFLILSKKFESKKNKHTGETL